MIGIDQSTQGTKALLFDGRGRLIRRADRAHRQIVNEAGWISHDPEEIWRMLLQAVAEVTEGIDRAQIAGVGISNQRETSLAWNRKTGKPVGNAVVWQCARAEKQCGRVRESGGEELIRNRTGLTLSPYFPAAKIAWILENNDVKDAEARGEICHGTMDSWVVWKLTGGRSYKTDYSNASRTQLFDIRRLVWDKEICAKFGINPGNMPEVCDSDGDFGETDFDGLLPHPVPIRAVLGDSHGSLLGQGCLQPGMVKATYGTGSSVMMNIGKDPAASSHGLVTSIAWKRGGSVDYVLEGNLNYTGAVITWLKDNLGLVQSPQETEELAWKAVKEDHLYLVPAFSGLGAPYWDSAAEASITGMTRSTGRAEIARAALECIGYQITDILQAMRDDSGVRPEALRVDGGPTKNRYLMQFQSDMAELPIRVPDTEELSGTGAVYACGMALGLWDDHVFDNIRYTEYDPDMAKVLRDRKYTGWKKAVSDVLTENYTGGGCR